MSGVMLRHHHDAGENKVYVEEIQDVEEIIERNKLLQTIPQKSDWGRHVAEIPNIFLNKWLHEEWARGNTEIRLFSKEMDRLVARKLRDPEWRFLRVDK